MPENHRPIGIELVRTGVATQEDIERALKYQAENPKMKLGDILYELNLCDSNKLLSALGKILDQKTMLLSEDDIRIKTDDYLSLDICNQNLCIPFDVTDSTISICFASMVNRQQIEDVRLLMLNRGLQMQSYITFEQLIRVQLNRLSVYNTNEINTDANGSNIVDNIIQTGMRKRASDIHIEPLQNSIRIRYRIDGIMLTIADIDKSKQTQIIGRLKAISNMHQEKQEPQDGRITMYSDYDIRSSSQKNIYGEKFVLRLLKKNQAVKQLFELGYPKDPILLKNAFDKRNSITVIAAPTGEGKTTSLYSAISYLNKPTINITTIEDPVEIRIPGLNQIEIGPKISFAMSLRTVLRQDPDIILVGEIRDQETAEIAMQAGQTGHYVLSTIHTLNSVEVISRLRKMNISDYDIASTMATSISQRLIRKICPKCCKSRPFTDEEKNIINKIGRKYNFNFDVENHTTFEPVGCEYCNNSGFYDRVAAFETFLFTDPIKDLITKGASTIELREEGLREGYKPLVIDGISKVVNGITTLDELNRKLLFY